MKPLGINFDIECKNEYHAHGGHIYGLREDGKLIILNLHFEWKPEVVVGYWNAGGIYRSIYGNNLFAFNFDKGKEILVIHNYGNAKEGRSVDMPILEAFRLYKK